MHLSFKMVRRYLLKIEISIHKHEKWVPTWHSTTQTQYISPIRMTQITTKVHFIWIRLIAISFLHTKSNVCLNKAYPLSPSLGGSPGLGIRLPSVGCFFLLLSPSSAPDSSVQFSSVQSLSCARLFETPWTVACQASLSITGVYQNSYPLNRWCHPTTLSSVIPFSSCLQSFPASESFHMNQFFIRWPKYWSFSISPSNEHSGLISFRMDWLDLLEVQVTLKSLLQHYSSKASILQCSAFFLVLLSHPYMTTGKTIALTRWTFVGKVMSLLFNMLSRLVIAFLSRSKPLLISWLQSPSAVILESPKIVSHCFHCFPIYLPWSDGTRCHDFSFLNVEL